MDPHQLLSEKDLCKVAEIAGNPRFCLRHLRRYAFIAQEMRRVNRAASTVLLELWVAWGASMLILLWTLGFVKRQKGKGVFWASPCTKMHWILKFQEFETIKVVPFCSLTTCALLCGRIIAEAGRHSAAWPFWILCYVSMEFYSLAHVRSQQSRWIFPRVTLLLNAGAAIYAFWWPFSPQWLLVSLVLWSHFTCLGPL